MTPPRDVLQKWVADHPVGQNIDAWGASRRGARRFRRWLVLRTVTAIVVGAAFVTGMIGLRLVVAGTVGARATASLVVSPGSGLVPLKITADGSGSTAGQSATIDAYAFDFGDGDSAGPRRKATVAHTYERPGRYTVTLTVTNSAGRADETSQEVTVADPPAVNPTAKLQVNPSSGPAPLEIEASGSASKAGADATVVAYAFDFGDGNTTGPQEKAFVPYTYKLPGSYTVTLTVTDSTGRTDDTSQEVTVSEPRPRGPTAELEVEVGESDPDGFQPLVVNAGGSGSVAGPGATIESYAFDFDDGTVVGPGPEESVRHPYSEPGTYTVTLTVSDSKDRTDTATIEVTVG